MPPPRRLAAAFFLLLAGAVAADTVIVAEPPVPLRQLCIDAPVVVLAAPADPVTPTRFRVQQVLRGAGVKAGELIDPAGLTAEQVRASEDPNLAPGKGRPRRVAFALLFLRPGEGGKGFGLLRGGMRACTEEGRYLAPEGPRWKLTAQEGTRWPVVVARVRQDLQALEQLDGYRRIGRPTRRVQALLGWVRQRKGDFTAAPPGTDESPAGWGRLQLAVFDWVFAAAGPEDAWQAARLYAELNQGEAPRLASPTFSTPAGRALLARVAADGRLLLGERARALQLLGRRPTLRPGTAERRQGAQEVDEKEREMILGQLLPLLAEKSEPFRIALASALASLGEGGPLPAKVLPALVQAYRDSLPGPGRDELALAVCALAPAGQWKELSGNPAGVCACLRDLERQDTTLTFWLALRTPGPAVFEQPTLVVDRLGTLGFVAETKRFPVEPLNLAGGWAAGWNGSDALAVRFQAGSLTPGSTYKVRVEGFVGKGKDRQKWTSEPRKFQLPARAADPNRRGRYYSIKGG